MTTFYRVVVFTVLVALGFGAGFWVAQHKFADADGVQPAAEVERKPLYWVAPMDAGYRRDGPGKSPMGMDLVPVYADDISAHPADVVVSAALSHNLGLTLATVESGPLERTIRAAGAVEFDQQALKHFHLRAAGWISNLAVTRIGDPVSKGQKLFDFYSPEIINAQQEFISVLALNHRQPGLMQSSQLKLEALGVSSREITEIAKSGKLKTHLAYYAEQDGYVASIQVSNGSYVDIDQNTLSVGPLENIWVMLELPERDSALLRKGQKVTLSSRAYPGEQWQGEVDYVYPVLDAVTRLIRARLVFSNRDGRLKPGMFVDLALNFELASMARHIPASAVIETGAGARVVKALGNHRYRSVAVRLGERSNDRIEVLEGLEAGDRFVTNGQFLIDSESAINTELARLNTDAENDSNDQATHKTKAPDDTNAPVDHSMHHHHHATEDTP